MKHSSRLIHELTEHAAGRLSEVDAQRIESHLIECEECQTWLETYDLLGSGLEHPSSHHIAEYAITPGAMTEEERDWVRLHAARCASCSGEIALAQHASENAAFEPRQETPTTTATLLLGVARPLKPERRGPYLLAAASFLLVAAIGSLVLRTSPRTADLPSEEFLISGTQLVEAEVDLFLAGSQILHDKEVTFRAGRAVSLGEGFSVSSSASVVVELDSKPKLEPDTR